MKTAAFLLLLPVLALDWSLGAASVALETADYAGHRYVRISDWARAANFDARWLQRDDTIQLTNRSYRLVFEKDSHNAGFNGVNVLLCYPFVVDKGVAYLAEADLRQTLGPLFSPAPNPGGGRIRCTHAGSPGLQR